MNIILTGPDISRGGSPGRAPARRAKRTRAARALLLLLAALQLLPAAGCSTNARPADANTPEPTVQAAPQNTEEEPMQETISPLPAEEPLPGEGEQQIRQDAPAPDTEEEPMQETISPLPAEEPLPGEGEQPVRQDAPAPDTEEQPAAAAQEALTLTIGDTPVRVEWEDNASAAALTALAQEAPLEIQMSMYGGFEQVGTIGQALPRSDVQTTTAAGDIVLYAGDQIVIFYGSNTWAYTRLGRITDPDAEALAELLGHGAVRITLRMEPEADAEN